MRHRQGDRYEQASGQVDEKRMANLGEKDSGTGKHCLTPVVRDLERRKFAKISAIEGKIRERMAWPLG
jgi:hypothetical protein